MAKLSIIIPVYNTEKYLEECLKSVISQTFSEMEIILVDDGSTDKSGEILDSYAARDNRIKVIHKKNGGIVSARQTGIMAVNSEYVGFVDSDDWIEPEMYERMLSVMDSSGVDCVVSGHFVDVGASSKKTLSHFPAGRYEKEAMIRKIYPDMIIHRKTFDWGVFPYYWNKLFRTRLLLPLLAEADTRITRGEDQATVFPYLMEAKSLYIMDECFYHYRQNPASMTKILLSPEMEREEEKRLYEDVKNSLQKYRHVYDMTEEWTRHTVWMMMQRSDALYDGIEELDFLFPFPGVKRGMRLVIYGAGYYGGRLYSFLKRTNFGGVRLWLDQNYAALRKCSLPVDSPAALAGVCEKKYDAVVIAITYPRIAEAVKDSLGEFCDTEKIHTIDTGVVFSKETMKAFHLV